MIKFAPNRKNHLGACTNDGSVMVWDINGKIPLCDFHKAHKSGVSSIAFS